MKKRILAVILAGMLMSMNIVPVLAAQNKDTKTEETEAAEETETAEETEAVEGTEAVEEGTEAAESTIVIPQGNMVDVDMIDLSLHSETEGDFTAVYAYENPFRGKDTSQGVILEFYAKPTWEVHELGAIFAFNGSGEYDGKLYFSPGSYLGYNSPGFGGFFDANLFNYTLVTDYIKDGAKMRIELMPDGFAVYADDNLCYDQTILDNPEASGNELESTTDFSCVLEWLSGAEALYFGYGSWWNAVGTNEANINLSEVNFRLKDGTVVMDQLKADKDLVESLGGSVEAAGESNGESSGETVKIASVDVEIFDINSVEYNGTSTLPVMAAAVAVVLVLSAVVVAAVTKKRKYDDV